MDFDGENVGIGVVDGGDDRAVEGGERREEADGVYGFGLGEFVNLDICFCHFFFYYCYYYFWWMRVLVRKRGGF